MKATRFIAIVTWLLCLHGALPAQERRVETTLEADIVSRYIWRGCDLGGGAVQPTLGVSWRGLSLEAWGSTPIVDSSDTSEMDLTLGYTLGGLALSITDYWFNEGPEPRNRYFRYSSNSTNHVFEATIGYDWGPLCISWSTNFAGNDGRTSSGKRAYSSYFELGVPFKVAGVEWSAALGIVPYETDLYGVDGFALTNLSLTATKAIRVTQGFEIPLFACIAANPDSSRAYLVFGLKLHP